MIHNLNQMISSMQVVGRITTEIFPPLAWNLSFDWGYVSWLCIIEGDNPRVLFPPNDGLYSLSPTGWLLWWGRGRVRVSTSGGWTGNKVGCLLHVETVVQNNFISWHPIKDSVTSFYPGENWIKIPLVNPTFWLNHIFFTTPYHWKNNTVSEQYSVCKFIYAW